MTRGSFYRYLATSNKPAPRLLRRLHHGAVSLSLPAPRVVVKPVLWIYLFFRSIVHFLKRVFICEPLFKAYCTKYGKNLRTGVFVHWIRGRGTLIVGNNVYVDGKCSFSFAHRFVDCPTLEIGDNTGIGHNCSFIVARKITIGRNCLLSGGNLVFDSSGHSSDAMDRRAGKPPAAEEVREVVIGNDVWIGVRAIIFPGVRVGDGSIISAGSVVRSHVPPRSVVAGNPAKVMFRLPAPSGAQTQEIAGHAPWMGV